MIFWLLCTGTVLSSQEQEEPVPQMKEWEADVRKRIAKDENLKALAAKYPLVLLHSRRLYVRGASKQSAYSFIYETSVRKQNLNDVQLLFDNGDPNVLVAVGQQSLVVDLGKPNFEKDPDPRHISIDEDVRVDAKTVEGHVYLERVRDKRGNNFYVVFQVVSVDPDGRYMAFLWRRLPGGQVVRQPKQVSMRHERGFHDSEADAALARLVGAATASLCCLTTEPQPEKPVPEMKQWEQDVRERIAKDEKLKALAPKYRLVLLYSWLLYGDDDRDHRTAFSFSYETSQPQKYLAHAQLKYDGAEPREFNFWRRGGQQYLLVDLEKVSFEKNPDPTRISIDGSNVKRADVKAVEGHVYLERIRDTGGNNFYVVFQLVAVDPDGRYVAFFWRRLPGGSVVK